MHHWGTVQSRLGYARKGRAHALSRDWTAVEDGSGDTRVYSAMSFSGRFYCATSRAVVALDAAGAANNEPPRLEVVAGLTFAASLDVHGHRTCSFWRATGSCCCCSAAG